MICLRSVVFIFLSLLLPVVTYSQERIIELMQVSNSLQKSGCLEASIDSSKKLITLIPQSNIEVIQNSIAEKYGTLGNADSAFHYLSLAHPSVTPLAVLIEPSFINIVEDARWETLMETALLNYKDNVDPNVDTNLLKRLLYMRMYDQAYYYEIQTIEDLLDDREYLTLPIWRAKEHLNKANQRELDYIISEHGWPHPDSLPIEASQAAFFVAQHCTDSAKQIWYYETYKAANYKDTKSLQNLAYLEDRINLMRGIPQKYGTQYKIDANGIKSYPSITDIKEINANRRKIGLDPIK